MSHLRVVKDGDEGPPDVAELLEKLVVAHAEKPIKSLIVLAEEESGSFLSWTTMTMAELHFHLATATQHVLMSVSANDD